MKFRNTASLLTAAALGLTLSTAAFAAPRDAHTGQGFGGPEAQGRAGMEQGYHGRRGSRAHQEHRGSMRGLFRLARALDLTEAQRTSTRGLLESNRDEAGAQREAIGEAQRNLRAAIHAADFDETAIRSAATVLADLEADAAVFRAEIFQDFQQLLTADQLTRLDEIRDTLGQGPGSRRNKN